MLSADVAAWLHHGTAKEFDALSEKHGLNPLILSCMEVCSDLPAQARIARQLQNAECLKRKSRKIQTIGVFYYRAYNGGLERVMTHLIALWTQAGYRVVLLTDMPAAENDYPLPASVRRYTLSDTFLLDEKGRQERYTKIQEILRREQVDVFVHHAWLSRNLLWDILAVKSLGIAYIQYTHGVFSCLLSEGNPKDMDEVTSLADIYRLPDLVISLSKAFDCFWSHFNPSTAVLINPCPVPQVSPSDRSHSTATLLWVGRIAPEKQPLDAIRIFAEVHSAFPQARLIMVGAADSAYADLDNRVRQLIADLKLQDAVSLTGFQQNVAPYYQSADVLLSTSMYEGFSLVIAEAKTYGVPCVMYELPYLYFAEENKGLFSVPQQDVSAAAAQIVHLLQDRVAWNNASAQALESAQAFSDETLSRRWVALFAALEQPATSALQKKCSETIMLETLLDHLHAGLEKVKKDAQARQETMSIRGSVKYICRRLYARFFHRHQ